MTTVALTLFALLAADPAPVAPVGAGATSAFPLYSKWISQYRKKTKLKVQYQAVGSRAGMERIKKGEVDFGATESPIADDEQKDVPGGLVHVPVAVAAMAFVYHVEGLPTGLRLSPDVIADIYLGKLTKWSDRRLKKLNPKLKLPAADIRVITGQGGGTYVVTDYLSAVSPEFKEKVGRGTKVTFPVGTLAQGADRIVEALKAAPGSIAYLDRAYAHHYKLPVALVQNAAGKFVEATDETMIAATDQALAAKPKDLRLSMVNLPGDKSYPLTSFTYAVLHRQPKDAARGKAAVEFLWWATHEGQQANAVLRYVALPPSVVAEVEQQLKAVQAGGKPLVP